VLIPAFVVQLAIMLGVPVALGFALRRRWGLPWMLYLAGAVTFIGSQVVHLPLNAGLTALFRLESVPVPPPAWRLPFSALVLGLTAGLCEEGARYLVLRTWLKDARTWRQAVVFGAGHGGIESVITGLLAALTLFNMIVMRGMDISKLGLPPEQADLAAEQIAAYWGMPAYMPLLGALERVLALLFHLSAATLVMQACISERLWPLWAAMAWHTALNAIAVYANGTWGALAAEGALVLLSLGSVALLWWTYRAQARTPT
jgi:uncharacterized membrane protein YhfC